MKYHGSTIGTNIAITIAMDYRLSTEEYKQYNVKMASDLVEVSINRIFQISFYFEISSVMINGYLFGITF